MASRERELILQKARVWLWKLKVPPSLMGDWRRLGILGLAGLTSLVLGWYASWWLVPVYLGVMSWLVGSPASVEEERGRSAGEKGGGRGVETIARSERFGPQAAGGSTTDVGLEAADHSQAALTKKKRKTVSSSAGKKRARGGANTLVERPVAIHFVKVGPGQFVRVEEPLVRVEHGEPANNSESGVERQQEELDGRVADDDFRSETTLEFREGGALVEPSSISRKESAAAAAWSETDRAWNPDGEGTLAEEPPVFSGLDSSTSVAAPDDFEQQYRGGVAEPFPGGVEDDLPCDPAASFGQAAVFEGQGVSGSADASQYLSREGGLTAARVEEP